jgi:UDP-N-acetylmuramyl pentapeptide phosphotransferase/UDP-N-acetylglucosamine-1-phosphate transferase
MIKIYLFICCISLASFFCVSILFKRLGIVDKPDGIRKIHEGEISLSGGIALFLTALICFFLISDEGLSFSFRPEFITVFFVSIIILFLGLWDDIRPLPTSARLIIQIFASWLVIILSDVYLIDLGDLFGFGNLYLGPLGIPITIFMVVGVCNAFNMLDGMDGLVGFVILVCTTAISLISYLRNETELLFLGSIMSVIFLF